VVDAPLCIVARDSRWIPARICGVLAQRNVAATSIQMCKPEGSRNWWIHLVVELDEPKEAQLLLKQLNRLVDVITVIDFSSEPSNHLRSVFVKVQPDRGELLHVRELCRSFAAEVIEVTPQAMTLFLSAAAERCEQLIGLLEPYNIAEICYDPIAVSAQQHARSSHPDVTPRERYSDTGCSGHSRGRTDSRWPRRHP
jgi:acetolactate synthase I/III small subunit